MSGVLSDVRGVGAGLLSRIVYSVAMVRRSTPGPALVRLIAAVATLVALAIALPAAALRSPWSALIFPVAIAVGLAPRTRWPGLVALLALVVWLITTIAYEPVTVWRTGALAAGLYVMHAAAAMAAVLPYDAIVAPVALVRWGMRVVVVLIGSLAGGLGGMVLVEQLQPVRTIAAPVLGSLIAAGVAGLLVWHLRRHSR